MAATTNTMHDARTINIKDLDLIIVEIWQVRLTLRHYLYKYTLANKYMSHFRLPVMRKVRLYKWSRSNNSRNMTSKTDFETLFI